MPNYNEDLGSSRNVFNAPCKTPVSAKSFKDLLKTRKRRSKWFWIGNEISRTELPGSELFGSVRRFLSSFHRVFSYPETMAEGIRLERTLAKWRSKSDQETLLHMSLILAGHLFFKRWWEASVAIPLTWSCWRVPSFWLEFQVLKIRSKGASLI